MTTDETRAGGLIDQVGVELEELRRAGDQLDEAVALQSGLNRTDLRCLGILYRRGRITAGELAEESGLTPGAITTVLDRLERGGYANRVSDPADRRRVLVVSTGVTRDIGARMQGEVELALREVLERREPEQLEVVRDFLRDTRGVFESQIAALTAEAAPGAGESPADGGAAQSHAPLEGIGAGRLEFTKGASQVRLTGDPGLTELYRATFEGPAPEIFVRGGTVTVVQRRRFFQRANSCNFTLAASIPWDVVLRGGMWKLDADLRPLRLSSLEVTGGASDVEIELPAPVGVVQVRLSGGASQVKLRRPKGTEARAEVSGGASQLVFDDQQLGAVGGKIALASPGFDAAVDRYEIRFTGGASQLSVTTL